MSGGSGYPGAVALVGSGEFLPVMDETDRSLLEAAGGPAQARVVVLPTAAGLEGAASSARWMRMGVDHFTRLGAQVDAVPVLDRTSAHDPRWVSMLEAADFIYFSGGNPHHLISTLAGSPAWAAIERRHRQGASLAGCSAGAMAICGLTAGRFRGLRDGPPPEWLPALGVVPRLVVLPHFDRMASFAGPEAVSSLVATAPEALILVGVDEDTALVRLDPAVDEAGYSTWQVMGRRSVSLLGRDAVDVFRAGETLRLAAGQSAPA